MIIPHVGVMTMFVLPAPFIVVALAVAWLVLPSTPAAAPAHSHTAAEATDSTIYGHRRTMSLLCISATRLGLLLCYGMGMRLPAIMRRNGFNLGSSLPFQKFMFGRGSRVDRLGLHRGPWRGFSPSGRNRPGETSILAPRSWVASTANR
jgi:hypothetical protein